MRKLIKIELFKLFYGKKLVYFYVGFSAAVFLFILYLRIVAPGDSFGNIVKTSIDVFSMFAVLVGVILALVLFNQEIQQKTIKSLLVTPVKRLEILFSKLFVSIFVSLLILIVLYLTSIIATTLLFGFFEAGVYSPSEDNILTFMMGTIQLVTAFFTTIFYSTIIICIFLITDSLTITMVGVVLLRGLGELVSRRLIDQNNLLLYFSPLGILHILNPIATNQPLIGYLIQLFLAICYSIVIFYICLKVFENKEF